MERYFRAFLLSILVMFGIVSNAEAAQFLSYPFSTNQDSRVYNDFNDHASYCPGCQGVDYDVVHGTPLYAAMSGTVTVDDGKGDQDDAQGCDKYHVDGINYGNYVKITNGSWEVIYGHMANGQMQVSNGSSVVAGQLLGYSSNSGFTCGEDYVTNGHGSSYHLHFEVEYNNVDKDPYPEGYFIIDSDGSYNYPDEADGSSSSGSSSYQSLISTEFNSVFSTYNQRNERIVKTCPATPTETEPPGFMLSTVTDSLHWWNYSGSGDPDPSDYWRDDGKYTTLLIENYTGSCNGAIVYDAFGGANRAFTVQCEQWDRWLSRNGPQGGGSLNPTDCGAPITNVYGKGKKWVQDFQDCIIVYNPDDDGDGSCDESEGKHVKRYPFDFSPGEMADGTWNTTYSYLFAERYELGGASGHFGYPTDGMRNSGTYYYQTFRKGDDGRQRTLYYDGSDVLVVGTGYFNDHLAGTVSSAQLAAYAVDEEAQIDEDIVDETDADGDGYTIAMGDCNDLSNGVHPGHTEDDDNRDNDCNNLVDDDMDADGYSEAEGDCNDLSNGIYPTHPEDIDNRDNNCDGMIDNDPYPDIALHFPSSGGFYTRHNYYGQAFTTYRPLWTSSWYTQNDDEYWYQSVTCDVDGDGFDEWVTYRPTGEVIVNDSGTDTWSGSATTWATTFGVSTGPHTEYQPHCGDMDGDGLEDLLLVGSNGNSYVGYSTGTSFSVTGDWFSGCDCGAQSEQDTTFTTLTGDFNGDGMTDVVIHHWPTGDWYTSLSTGAWFTMDRWYTSFGGEGAIPLTGDLNGDGLTDIVSVNLGSDQWLVTFSTGDTFTDQQLWLQDEDIIDTDQVFLEDLNADGYADAIRYDPYTGSWYVGLNTGASFQDMDLWLTSFGAPTARVYWPHLHR